MYFRVTRKDRYVTRFFFFSANIFYFAEFLVMYLRLTHVIFFYFFKRINS